MSREGRWQACIPLGGKFSSATKYVVRLSAHQQPGNLLKIVLSLVYMLTHWLTNPVTLALNCSRLEHTVGRADVGVGHDFLSLPATTHLPHSCLQYFWRPAPENDFSSWPKHAHSCTQSRQSMQHVSRRSCQHRLMARQKSNITSTR